MTPAAPDAIIEVDGLKVWFAGREGIVRAVDGVSFELLRGETLGIVGESGCGKSVTAMTMLQLIPSPPSVIAGGSIRYNGEDLLRFDEQRMRTIRGNEISMIFQDPMTSLNPVLTVGEQIAEPAVLHRSLNKRAAHALAVEMLQKVGISEPHRRAGEYPHQFSGGMRQRAMIAAALACNPRVLIADEPTTALDVTIQAQILELMLELKREFGTSIILITHDLGVVAETCARVVVMYAGRKVEEAEAAELFAAPLHPYTQGLLSATPRLETAPGARRADRPRLQEIPGMVPTLRGEPTACSFAPRCPRAIAICRESAPVLEDYGNGHLAACFNCRRP
ncbi:MAG TPA: ABC transporter ATP-binding protein [Desulfobacterales bacterium]|nr:ABC transporter ATP-binding protein [Desulfobacterales bacterium]